MVNLIKYEFIRKSRTLAIFLAIALGLNTAVVMTLKSSTLGSPEQMISMFFFFIGMLMAFFLLFIIDTTVMYSQDLQRKSGYMIFLTPNSGYAILGSKVLTGIIEGFLFLFVYLILVSVNFLGIYGQPFAELMKSDMYTMITTHSRLSGISIFPFLTVNLISAFVSVVTLVLTIFAGISISKSILAEKKFGGLMSFISIIVIGWANSQIISVVFSIAYKSGLLTEGVLSYGASVLYTIMHVILGGLLFVASAYLLEKRIDL